jgi:hypothetical protein
MTWPAKMPKATKIRPYPYLLGIRAERCGISIPAIHPWLADDINERGIDRLTPVHNMLDLTPQGRGDWYADLSYQRSNGALTKAT